MSESILSIGPVKRDIAKAIVGLASTSGGGKTRSALEMAFGLAGGDPSKIGLIDTESGRGAMYSHIFDKPYMYAQLKPPYSPQRYSQAFIEMSRAGAMAIVGDSMSHEWEGDGGCEDIAEQALIDGKKMKDWIRAKREHHRFMATLLAVPCHLVLCFRAREKTDFKTNPSKPTSLGIQPICEKNVMYEMTVSFMLDNGGQSRTPLKTIPDFFPFLNGQGYLTRDHGRQIGEWFGGKDQTEIAKKTLSFAASQGVDALKAAWVVLSPTLQKELTGFKNSLKETALHATTSVTIPTGDGERIKW